MKGEMENTALLEPEEDKQEKPAYEDIKLELQQLRSKQTVSEGWTEEDKERLLYLQSIEDEHFGAPLSEDEREEMRGLQTSQSKSTDWTPEKADRLSLLQRRTEVNTKKPSRGRF